MSAAFALVLRSKCATTVVNRSDRCRSSTSQQQQQPAFDTARRSAPPESHQFNDDTVPTRPITCDVAVAPRRPAVDEFSRDGSPARNPGVFLAPEQELLPCGSDNVLVLRDLPRHESEYLLNLSSCQVAGSNFTLQVFPLQSSFPFSLGIGADAGYARELGGERVPTGEVTVEFDMSSAVRAQSECVEIEEIREQKQNFVHPLIAERKEVLRGVVLSLERESRFVKTALSVMAGMGIVLLVAIAWTVANMRSIMRPRASRSRTRSRQPSIPREVVHRDHGQDSQSSSMDVRTDEKPRATDAHHVSSTCSSIDEEGEENDGPDEKSEEPVQDTTPQSEEGKVLQPALRSW